MSFSCALCYGSVSLQSLAELPCSCLVCSDCSGAEFGCQVRRQQHAFDEPPTPPPKVRPAATTSFEPGETVLYLNSSGVYVEAIVEIIDISVQPPQYGIQLQGSDNLRFTEEHRLCSTKPRPAAAPAPLRRNAPPPPPFQQQQTLVARCPRCYAAVSQAYLRMLVPEAVAAWEAERTSAWLRVHDIIACPHAGCGALIQRVPAGAAGRGGGAADAGANVTPARRRRSSMQRPDAAAAAAAHRELHRYRCGACARDFCDACRAAPYHTGFTCRQARAPDCLMCGGKVDEDRVERLLPAAAAAAAEAAGDDADSDAEAAATAIVKLATRAALLAALKKLEVDTVWCLERRDLEKAFLHWGGHTCSSPECAERLRGMCGRPLPCGHWCCGLRGEGDTTAAAATSQAQTKAHPRCVECGADPRVSASPGGGGAAGAKVGAAALISDCCFCWEPLSSAPCIELACGPRHPCHLHCARARLEAGYSGPHISFTHLYCPLCRGGAAGSGGGGAAAAERSPGGSSAAQFALSAVHLDHPALRAALEPHLALRSETVTAVRARLRMDPSLRADPELRPGGRYDGRPADYGLDKLNFYKCSKCASVYYGGQRACGAAGPDAAAQQQQQQQQHGAGVEAGANGGNDALLCGGCCARAAGNSCARHGTNYIEWKCRYCCSLASWFCWGTTHMCEPCHADNGRAHRRGVIGTDQDVCKDPKCGLKGIPHPPPGHEACLGCGMCRNGL